MLVNPIAEEAWSRKANQQDSLSALATPQNGILNSADTSPWELAVQTVIQFQQLGDNWDGQGAPGPSPELLASAIGLASLLNEQGVAPPSRVVPGPEGSVIFEWQEPEGMYTEIEIDRPLHAEVMWIEPGQPAKHWTLPTE